MVTSADELVLHHAIEIFLYIYRFGGNPSAETQRENTDYQAYRWKSLKMATVNQQWKETMKRLMLDLKELQNSPIPVVSAAPLEDNFREWHCNIVCDGLVVHVIVFIGECYPYTAPKAEFMPMGLRFSYGATRNGEKGTQLCMSLLSNYSDHHTEWKSEQNYGWSPGYTIQSLLLNLLAYIDDLKFGTKNNQELIADFTCPDCGHATTNPYPPLNGVDVGSSKITKRDTLQTTCYISKVTMNSSHNPDTDDELFGFGLQNGPPSGPRLSSPCEFLTYGAFHNMKKTFGVVHDSVKKKISYFLPLFLHPNHGACIKQQFEQTIGDLSDIFQNRCPEETVKTMITMVNSHFTTSVLKILPHLMASTSEGFIGSPHGSDNLLTGFFVFHRLFLWAVDTYPDLQKKIDNKIEEFLRIESLRDKNGSQDLAKWIMLVSVSSKYRWHDVAEVIILEIWKRDVEQYVEDGVLLGDLNTDKRYGIENTFTRTEYSRKSLATQVVFLNTAMPARMGRDDVIRRYDSNLGYPTADMVLSIREDCQKIRDAKLYADLYLVLNLTPIDETEKLAALLTSVKSALKTRQRSDGWRGLRKKNRSHLSSGQNRKRRKEWCLKEQILSLEMMNYMYDELYV